MGRLIGFAWTYTLSLSLHCVSLPPYGHTSDNQSGKRTIHPLLPQSCPRGISYQQPSTASGVQP